MLSQLIDIMNDHGLEQLVHFPTREKNTLDLILTSLPSQSKANRTLGFLRRNLLACPQDVKESAYIGLVRPVLEYGSSVWDTSGILLQEELEKVQKRAARFVTGNYIYETGSMTGILEQLKWESLKKRRRDTCSRIIML